MSPNPVLTENKQQLILLKSSFEQWLYYMCSRSRCNNLTGNIVTHFNRISLLSSLAECLLGDKDRHCYSSISILHIPSNTHIRLPSHRPLNCTAPGVLRLLSPSTKINSSFPLSPSNFACRDS